jgi:hypothetical protein
MFKKINLIIASVSLAIIVSCNSVKKIKTKTSETENSVKTETFNTTVSDTNSKSIVGTTNINAFKQALQIDYEPKFDINGNLIPFTFASKNANGTTTNVNISGSGKVKYFTEDQVEDVVNNLQESFNKKLDSLAEKRNAISIDRTIESKDKIIAPDYLKYIIGIIITLLFFSAIITLMYFYFKKKIVTLTTKLIP